MLGRKNFTQEEIDNGKATINEQFAVYKKLSEAIASEKTDKKLQSKLEDFEGLFFNNMTLVLDRYYVHRLRSVTGKDGTPLNEVELICESLMNNNGILQGQNVIKYKPDQSVVKLNIGDKIRLTAEEFERLSAAFFVELESKYLQS
ncbi:MAG: hypothetical protein FVQ83_10965 [Chloroflexi bacterium]|nr:hypothetical protein [Chloroflexota bacterium]